MYYLDSKSSTSWGELNDLEINQLYRPVNLIGFERHTYLYSQNEINSTKFSPILIKEWFQLLADKGFLIIDYVPSEKFGWSQLEELFWWLLKGKYQIVFHSEINSSTVSNSPPSDLKSFIQKYLSPGVAYEAPSSESSHIRFICQKTDSSREKMGSIDKWTFGILANGKREDWISKMVESIRSQKILDYEIIICGKYDGAIDHDMVYLPFNAKDKLGWITRKKNLLAQKAKYENLCLLHNRLVLAPDWYSGMQKWGNAFEVLNVIQSQESTQKKGNHWEVSLLDLNSKTSRYASKNRVYFSSSLEYSDWDEHVVQYGQAIIIKKHIMLEVPQNETLYWSMSEDRIFSQDLIRAGYLIRLNPYSQLINLDSKNWTNDSGISFSKTTLGKENGPLVKVIYRKLLKSFLKPFSSLQVF